MKARPIYMLSTRDPSQTYRHLHTENKGMGEIVPSNGNQKKAGIATLISDKIDLKIKKIKSDKEGHYMIIKRSIQEEDKTSVNIYAPNIGAPQYIRQTLTDAKGEIDSNTIIVGDFNIPLSSMDRSDRKSIRKHGP